MTKYTEKRKTRAVGRFRDTSNTVLMVVCGILFISPVLVILIMALQFEGKFITLRQFDELLITNYTFLRFFWNSLGYSLCITAICIVISLPLGFLFAKVRVPGMDALIFVYIVVMMLPFQATLLPNYIMLRDFGLLNTPAAIVLPLALSPFAVFLFCQFIKAIPNELIEYTIMTTSSPFQVIGYAVLPQIKPAIAALSVLIFCESWNMVEPVLIFAAKNPDIHPLSVRMSDLPLNVSFSVATVYLVPILMLFLIFKEVLAVSMERFRWD